MRQTLLKEEEEPDRASPQAAAGGAAAGDGAGAAGAAEAAGPGQELGIRDQESEAAEPRKERRGADQGFAARDQQMKVRPREERRVAIEDWLDRSAGEVAGSPTARELHFAAGLTAGAAADVESGGRWSSRDSSGGGLKEVSTDNDSLRESAAGVRDGRSGGSGAIGGSAELPAAVSGDDGRAEAGDRRGGAAGALFLEPDAGGAGESPNPVYDANEGGAGFASTAAALPGAAAAAAPESATAADFAADAAGVLRDTLPTLSTAEAPDPARSDMADAWSASPGSDAGYEPYAQGYEQQGWDAVAPDRDALGDEAQERDLYERGFEDGELYAEAQGGYRRIRQEGDFWAQLYSESATAGAPAPTTSFPGTSADAPAAYGASEPPPAAYGDTDSPAAYGGSDPSVSYRSGAGDYPSPPSAAYGEAGVRAGADDAAKPYGTDDPYDGAATLAWSAGVPPESGYDSAAYAPAGYGAEDGRFAGQGAGAAGGRRPPRGGYASLQAGDFGTYSEGPPPDAQRQNGDPDAAYAAYEAALALERGAAGSERYTYEGEMLARQPEATVNPALGFRGGVAAKTGRTGEAAADAAEEQGLPETLPPEAAPLVAEGKALLREGRALARAGRELGRGDGLLRGALAAFEAAAMLAPDSAAILVREPGSQCSCWAPLASKHGAILSSCDTLRAAPRGRAAARSTGRISGCRRARTQQRCSCGARAVGCGAERLPFLCILV